MLSWRKIWTSFKIRHNFRYHLNKFAYVRLFATNNTKSEESKVLTDIEKGGTFNSRKRVPKIVSKELKEKIINHSSDSSGEYLFSSQRRRDMIRESINSNTNVFSSYTGGFSGPKNENAMNAFVTDVQGSSKISFSGNGKQANISEFQNKTKIEQVSSNSRELASKLKKLTGKLFFFR